MKRREFLSLGVGVVTVPRFVRGQAATPATSQQPLHPGIWKFTFGRPEAITPVRTRRYREADSVLAALPSVSACPVTPSASTSMRGCLVRIPLAAGELVYGLGLQMQSFIQRGLKKKLRVNADPSIDSGDSHAPVPFYVTTRGYGVLIDTARYATFYCGNKPLKSAATKDKKPPAPSPTDALPASYRRYRFGEASEVLVEIPVSRGVDVYVFGGPSMRAAVQRYNLFSGGGALPPRWGLGNWYRAERDFGQDDVLALAREFRARNLPIDVIGLEPGWQTHSYSCSYVWSERFPAPAAMIEKLADDGFQLNLWEHAFTHPTSPIYDALYPHAGDYDVWDGIVPDFLERDAQRIFGEFHEKEHVAIGVAGYKLDECDNSDFTRNWSFPELSAFPSGADGEQMHSLFGLRYQDTIQAIFDKRGRRTYGLVRSSQALAAPYPYVLYSDLYDHATFIHSIAEASFSGLLWTPEVRDAKSERDLIRRLQSVVFSPMALINAWYIKNPPWKQINRDANNKGVLAKDWETLEASCKAILDLRMRFIPYLHAAFVRYHREGLPPFRAMVMDFPDDPGVWTIDDQYMMGDHVIVAPLLEPQERRNVYLPKGAWFDFWSGTRHEGGHSLSVEAPLDRIPLFVRDGSILPLADVTLHTGDPVSRQLTVSVYGNSDASLSLYEDDGRTPAALTEVKLSWDARSRRGTVAREREVSGPRYEIKEWIAVQGTSLEMPQRHI
jgi:alpha-D-xyloside xylohydrolase